MIDFFLLLLCVSMLCLGVHATTRQGSIFGLWQYFVRNSKGELRFILAKPMSECLTCSSSLYGAICFGMYFGFDSNPDDLLGVSLGTVIGFVIIEMRSKDKLKVQVMQILERISYVAFIVFFCIEFYGDRFLQAIAFIVCLSGLNYFVESILANMTSNIEINEHKKLNGIDQDQAFTELSEHLINITDSIKTLKNTDVTKHPNSTN